MERFTLTPSRFSQSSMPDEIIIMSESIIKPLKLLSKQLSNRLEYYCKAFNTGQDECAIHVKDHCCK